MPPAGNIIHSQVIWALDDDDFRRHLLEEAKLADITQKLTIHARYEWRRPGVGLPEFIRDNLEHFMGDLVRYIDQRFSRLFTMRNGIERYLEPTPAEPSDGDPADATLGRGDKHVVFFDGMGAESLIDLFARHERAIWERVRTAGRAEMTMGEIADEMDMDWPRKTAGLTVGSFEHKGTSVLRTRGYGKKLKLPMLLSCILWAALDGKPRGRPEGPMSPSDVLDAVNLTDAEERVVHIRFMDVEPRTLDEAGKVLGLTRERVRQIQEYAFERIRRRRLAEPLRDWVFGQRERVFELLSKDGGVTVLRADAHGSAARKTIPGFSLALELCDVSVGDLLAQVAVAGPTGHWIRRV